MNFKERIKAERHSKYKKFNLKDFFKPILNTFKSLLQRNVLTESLDVIAGLESELQNPDTVLTNKGKDLTFYDTMMLDDRIKFSVDLKKKMVLSVGWKITPASDEDADTEIAEWTKDVFNTLNIRFNDVLENVLDSMVYGFKVGEIIWEMIEGKWRWTDIHFKHSLFFDFAYDEYGNLKYMEIGKNYGGTDKIEPEDFEQKFLYFCYPYLKDGNMYGDSDLKEIYMQWYAKTHIFKYRNLYIQNFGFPVPIVKYDYKKLNATEKQELEDMLENWQECMRVMIPSVRNEQTGALVPKFEIEWRDINTTKGTDIYERTIDQLDRQITRKLLLPDKMGYTQDEAGAYSQSKVFFDLLIMIIKDLHKRLEDVINKKIKFMVGLNFPTDDVPLFQFDEVDEGVEKEMLQMLLEKGVIDKREKWIRSYVGIPDISDKEKEEIKAQKEEDKQNLPQYPFPQGFGQRQFKNPVNTRKIEQQLNSFEADFLNSYNRIYNENVLWLIRQLESKKIVENKDYKTMKKMRIKKTELKRLLNQYYDRLYFTGKADAIIEIEDRLENVKSQFKNMKVEITDEFLDRAFIDRFLEQFGELGVLTKEDREFLKGVRDKTILTVDDIENKMLKIMTQTVETGIRGGLPVKTIASQVKQFLNEDSKKYAETTARTLASDNYNKGRFNFFNKSPVSDFVEAYRYDAMMDDRTTPFCQAHNGQVILQSDPSLEMITPPNHFNCRSILVPILVGENDQKGNYFKGWKDNKDEFPDWNSNKNASGERFNIGDKSVRNPAKGFGGS